ncbi:HNH endonuclease signature motif containing protein [Microbispora hainanensis]|nr:DUF222 domain-containing protein [Microbispora hainanensis]
MCLAEAEELLFARDRITCALADRVGRVHRAGQAKQHGHASTRCWLRTAAGMTVGGAGRLLMLGAELPRLPVVREKFAVGELAAGVVEAICAAVAGLTDEQAALAEPILVELAGKAGAAEVAKAGRHLRAVLDPDGEERDERADYGRRFLRVRPGKGGGVEGEFYIPREPGARLMTLLQEYAKKKADGDDRTLTERQADALIAALEQQIVTELLVVVSAESLPTDPENTDPATDDPADGFDAAEADDSIDDVSDPATDDPADYAPDAAGSTDEPSQADDTADHVEDARDAEGFEEGRDRTGDPALAEADDLDIPEEFDAAEAEADAGAGSADDTDAPAPAEADDISDHFADLSDSAPSGYAPDATGNPEAPNEAVATGDCDGDAESADPATGSPYATSGLRDGESRGCGAGEPGTGERRPGECEPPGAAWPDPPPEDGSAHHTHAGPRPAGDCRHGQGIPGALGASAGTLSGALLGASLGMVPGLLLATGQVLPVSSVHRLARTSTLVRIVMNAEGQVLDMGRKVRLATPAQRRAVFARYATCWIDGCPLPATMCQIDHADNWSTGGLTDLKLLGPACQFHNRDRYHHPDRYTRRQVGTDRWAFTYHRIGSRRPRE